MTGSISVCMGAPGASQFLAVAERPEDGSRELQPTDSDPIEVGVAERRLSQTSRRLPASLRETDMRDGFKKLRCAVLLLLITALECLSAESLKPVPGTTLVAPLAGQTATNQAELLAKLRRLPKEVPSEARTFASPKSSREAIRYRLYKPLKFDPVTTYPLVLSLHGGGPRRSFDHLLEPFSPGFAYGIGRLVSPDTQSKHPAFVIVPWSGGRGWDAANIRLVIGIIDSVRTEFKIDPKRIYVTGQSMGGTGTWTILDRHPNVFAAAIPICGWGEPAAMPRIKNIPVWAIHGNADTIMPVAGSRDIVKALLKAGAKPIYWEYDGASHAVTAERAYCEPALIDCNRPAEPWGTGGGAESSAG